MRIVIGADKGGFALKEAITEYLRDSGYGITDIGTLSLDNPIPFGEVATKAGMGISAGMYDRGILLCGTGMGMSIFANKFPGARAAVVESQYAAMYARKINDANILCMGGFIIGASMGIEITDTFLNTEFVQDFPQWRVDFLNSQLELLTGLENKNFK